MKHTFTGFTLVEFLLVIGGIALLSAAVFANINLASSEGPDMAVKANLDAIFGHAKLIFEADGDYDAVCGTDGVTQNRSIRNALDAASQAGAGSATAYVCTKPLVGVAGAWAAVSPLRSRGVWCVDSTGVARSETLDGVPYTGVTSGDVPALNDENDPTCN